MGKGVVSDTDVHCVAPARTTALQYADVIVLFGARLNWMLHFGRAPRFDPNVKIIQVCKLVLDLRARSVEDSLTNRPQAPSNFVFNSDKSLE